VVVHCSILWRSTIGGSCPSLPLLGFLVGVDYIVRDHDIADKLWKCPSGVECHALLQLGGETDHEVVLLLLFRVHLVRRILRQVVELLGVVMHGPFALCLDPRTLGASFSSRLLGCSGRRKHHGTQPTTLDSPRGEWRCSWPTIRWRHHAAAARRRESSAPLCNVAVQTWTPSLGASDQPREALLSR
jgi:hypothetical protein